MTRALVSLTDSAGNIRYAQVNAFGYYRFDELEAGQTYIVQPSSKGYYFNPQVVTPTEDVTDMNFSAE